MTPNDFDDAFRDRLRRLRKQCGLSQAQMADALGISSGNSYSKYENRSGSMLPLHYLPKVSAITGASLDFIITGRGKAVLRRVDIE